MACRDRIFDHQVCYKSLKTAPVAVRDLLESTAIASPNLIHDVDNGFFSEADSKDEVIDTVSSPKTQMEDVIDNPMVASWISVLPIKLTTTDDFVARVDVPIAWELDVSYGNSKGLNKIGFYNELHVWYAGRGYALQSVVANFGLESAAVGYNSKYSNEQGVAAFSLNTLYSPSAISNCVSSGKASAAANISHISQGFCLVFNRILELADNLLDGRWQFKWEDTMTPTAGFSNACPAERILQMSTILFATCFHHTSSAFKLEDKDRQLLILTVGYVMYSSKVPAIEDCARLFMSGLLDILVGNEFSIAAKLNIYAPEVVHKDSLMAIMSLHVIRGIREAAGLICKAMQTTFSFLQLQVLDRGVHHGSSYFKLQVVRVVTDTRVPAFVQVLDSSGHMRFYLNMGSLWIHLCLSRGLAAINCSNGVAIVCEIEVLVHALEAVWSSEVLIFTMSTRTIMDAHSSFDQCYAYLLVIDVSKIPRVSSLEQGFFLLASSARDSVKSSSISGLVPYSPERQYYGNAKEMETDKSTILMEWLQSRARAAVPEITAATSYHLQSTNISGELEHDILAKSVAERVTTEPLLWLYAKLSCQINQQFRFILAFKGGTCNLYIIHSLDSLLVSSSRNWSALCPSVQVFTMAARSVIPMVVSFSRSGLEGLLAKWDGEELGALITVAKLKLEGHKALESSEESTLDVAEKTNGNTKSQPGYIYLLHSSQSAHKFKVGQSATHTYLLLLQRFLYILDTYTRWATVQCLMACFYLVDDANSFSWSLLMHFRVTTAFLSHGVLKFTAAEGLKRLSSGVIMVTPQLVLQHSQVFDLVDSQMLGYRTLLLVRAGTLVAWLWSIAWHEEIRHAASHHLVMEKGLSVTDKQFIDTTLWVMAWFETRSSVWYDIFKRGSFFIMILWHIAWYYQGCTAHCDNLDSNQIYVSNVLSGVSVTKFPHSTGVSASHMGVFSWLIAWIIRFGDGGSMDASQYQDILKFLGEDTTQGSDSISAYVEVTSVLLFHPGIGHQEALEQSSSLQRTNTVSNHFKMSENSASNNHFVDEHYTRDTSLREITSAAAATHVQVHIFLLVILSYAVILRGIKESTNHPSAFCPNEFRLVMLEQLGVFTDSRQAIWSRSFWVRDIDLGGSVYYPSTTKAFSGQGIQCYDPGITWWLSAFYIAGDGYMMCSQEKWQLLRVNGGTMLEFMLHLAWPFTGLHGVFVWAS